MSEELDEERERPIGVVLWSSPPDPPPQSRPDERWIVVLIG
jgi:hypothetical protein